MTIQVTFSRPYFPFNGNYRLRKGSDLRISSGTGRHKNSTPTAFTAAVISDHTYFFFKLVTLLVNLLCRMAKFSSTFSFKIEISEALKLCFLGLRDPSPEAILVLFAGCKQQTRNKIPSVLWDANLGLVTVNRLTPRLTKLSFNPALNNAVLTKS